MEKSIFKLVLSTEADLPGLYQKATQLTRLAGIITKKNDNFAQAVTDVCRDLLKHIGAGTAEFMLAESENDCFVEALITDNYKLDKASLVSATSGKTDQEEACKQHQPADAHHTRVWLKANIPASKLPIDRNMLREWRKELGSEQMHSASDALMSGSKLLELLSYLRMIYSEVAFTAEESQQTLTQIEHFQLEVLQYLDQHKSEQQVLKLQNEHLDSFAYSVSHDLKSPLQNLEALIAEFRKNVEAGDIDKINSWLALLQEQVERMKDFISGMLKSARSTAPEKQKRPVFPSNLLRNLIRSLEVPDGFTVEVDPFLPQVLASPVKLNQVFSNLICNAIQHHDKKRGRIRVTGQLNKQIKMVKFAVKDDGPGIEPGMQAAIFDLLKYNKDMAGDCNGLGLFIVKQIVAENGGDIWVKSKGRGCNFYFTWPASSSPEKGKGDTLASP